MKKIYIIMLLIISSAISEAKDKIGADIPWTTMEAEKMKTTGTVLGPKYGPFLVETESSGQQCVKLTSKGQYIEFKAEETANSLVIRFSLPDTEKGEGTKTTLGIYKNGKLLVKKNINSYYSWLYGNYPFTNLPKDGKPRNFYDEVRVFGIDFAKGDIIRIKRDDTKEDNADYCILDFVDVENVAPALKAPANSISITEERFKGNKETMDYTDALLRCITEANQNGKTVWIPAGTLKITRDINLPKKTVVQGAGMWHTILEGDAAMYPENSSNRVRFRGDGDSILISDFSILGKLNYREDSEPNDGIGGSFGTNSTVARLWIEHTKAGVWVENSSGLMVEGCRFRNTIADGANFCVGIRSSTMKNCTARGTGDDCFAMWPATFLRQYFKPGENVITHCTAQLPFLANGAAIYGGENNRIEYCSFIDINPGSAILISTTFPVTYLPKNLDNNLTGKTVIESCDIKTSGGYDHGWTWRAAIQLCMDKHGIAGVEINNTTIENSFSDGLSVVAVNEGEKVGNLENTVLNNCTITKSSIGVEGKHDLWIQGAAHGGITIKNSKIADKKNDAKEFKISE